MKQKIQDANIANCKQSRHIGHPAQKVISERTTEKDRFKAQSLEVLRHVIWKYPLSRQSEEEDTRSTGAAAATNPLSYKASLEEVMFFIVGLGLTNVVKVFKMQQIDGVRLEKLRGGSQDRLIRGREGHAPLILAEETRAADILPPTPYEDLAKYSFSSVLEGRCSQNPNQSEVQEPGKILLTHMETLIECKRKIEVFKIPIHAARKVHN
ncbi:unnamed protein product [Dovyalis caffra]|uniref:Uncharacterized protein n=1 Tax=Dovyalis caffra TaxID=77055 RepID=A0AAV1QR89_9ROSI|nr:unnamed protein product [Dovyalis caffra]